jgi:hypothetical protein
VAHQVTLLVKKKATFAPELRCHLTLNKRFAL